MAAGASSGSASAAAVAKMGRSLSGRRCMKVGLCMRAPGIGSGWAPVNLFIEILTRTVGKHYCNLKENTISGPAKDGGYGRTA
eukprot:1140523-Pelagomonas_calceolata.AAC.7